MFLESTGQGLIGHGATFSHRSGMINECLKRVLNNNSRIEIQEMMEIFCCRGILMAIAVQRNLQWIAVIRILNLAWDLKEYSISKSIAIDI